MATRKRPSELKELREKAAKALGVSAEEAELRALRELLQKLDGAKEPRAAPAPEHKSAPPPAAKGYLPQRLYLLLDGRGLEGRGMPVEVIELPCVIGSGRKSNIWINSPRIETRHAQITRGDEGWVLEDLGSEHGTFVDGKKIQRRVIENGDEFQLSGYLRMRAELR